MQSQPAYFISPQQYLALERAAETKSEYWNGHIYAMSGANHAHNLIVTNLVVSIGSQFKSRSCQVYSSDMRVKVNKTGLYTYPDIAAVCGQAEFEDAHGDTLLNPTVIIEVLSKSTENYDRSTKFEHYRGLPSLRDYLLVAQSRPAIDHYVRQTDGRWLLTAHRGLDPIITIASIDCYFTMADVYDKVELGDDDFYSASMTVLKDSEPAYTFR